MNSKSKIDSILSEKKRRFSKVANLIKDHYPDFNNAVVSAGERADLMIILDKAVTRKVEEYRAKLNKLNAEYIDADEPTHKQQSQYMRKVF